jgi:hypothetical protein
MVSERKSLSEMVGEAAREAGVLVLVFGLLDGLIDANGHDWQWYAGAVSFGIILLSVGFVVELRR